MTDTDDKERAKAQRLLRQATEKKHDALQAGDRHEAQRWAVATEVLAKTLGDEPLDGTQS